MTLMDILPIIVYFLAIILLVVLIILGIKLIIVVTKTDKMLDDIQGKLSSFDSIFRLLDFASDKLSIGVSTIVESIVGFINRIFKKRKDEDEYYE